MNKDEDTLTVTTEEATTRTPAGEQGDSQAVSDVLAAEKDQTVSLERTSDGKNAHIVIDGSTLCPNDFTTTTPITEATDFPTNGLCSNCRRWAKLTEVITLDDVRPLLPDTVELAPTGSQAIRTDGGEVEAGYITNPQTRTLHRGTQRSGAVCGIHAEQWQSVTAPNPLIAVYECGTPPCSNCFDHTHGLNRVYINEYGVTPDSTDLSEITTSLPWSMDSWDDGSEAVITDDAVHTDDSGVGVGDVASETNTSTEAETNPKTDQYDTLLRAADKGLRLTVNNKARSQRGTGELQVLRSRDDETSVELKKTVDDGVQYRIHRDFRGDLVYSQLTDDGLSLQGYVTTIEIVGC